ncbi:cytochrome c55X [Modicisalibacter ilicicola DSM 19980]|uniref:Cytochrome c55X n=1 Tax=Modicisalibacter ilicicola DSM 19980 TaxID=1121942 RepID=A0A1M4SGQ7_9GAMM|nr:cytochrome c [Halomonas ilicicola]SHE31177.1 cytochrome c55X [Halomonas ilicicola DSM 19980]
MHYRHWSHVVLLGLLPMLATADPSPSRQAELETLLYQDCGSCHGMTLKGGLGPSLSPERMERFSAEAVTGIILYGVPGTAMPGWSDLLTEQEAAWLADQLKQEPPPSSR